MSGNVCVPTTSTDNLSASVERQDEEDDKYDTEDCEDTCPHHKVYDTVRPYSLVGDLGERLVEQVSHCPAHSSAIHLALESDTPGAVCVVGEAKPLLQQVEDEHTIRTCLLYTSPSPRD